MTETLFHVKFGGDRYSVHGVSVMQDIKGMDSDIYCCAYIYIIVSNIYLHVTHTGNIWPRIHNEQEDMRPCSPVGRGGLKGFT